MLAASGELLAERAGVLNIGLEGMMLAGAFFAFLGTWATASVWLGVLAGLLAGATLAALMALLSIEARADQIVVGVGLNLLALGTTTFVYRAIFSGRTQVIVEHMRPALFGQIPLVYVAFLLVPAAWIFLYWTRPGLIVRATGEMPEAADVAGADVKRVRWLATLAAGGLAGMGGAFLTVGQLGLFIEGMSGGRGFLAVAAVIFGRWHPVGVLGACLVFGTADALQLRLQAAEFVPPAVWLLLATVALSFPAAALLFRRMRRAHLLSLALALAAGVAALAGFFTAPRVVLPSQWWLALPYVLALLALAGVAGRSRAPLALALPYRRESAP